MPAAKAVGIDLGTTNSCVAVFENDEVVILTNTHSKRTTPSIVEFFEDMIQIGQWAKSRMHEQPLNVIYCIKRLIGRQFNDSKIQEDIKNLPYQIVRSENGNVAVEVEYEGVRKVYSPEEISAFILKDLMETANSYLTTPVKDAVITIPAYFNDSQRQATIDAAKLAGINVLRILNEPTAAALAYGYKQKWTNGKILVYDLGGGTLDVSIIDVTNDCCKVLAVDGDVHLGGEDFDNILVKYCIEQFQLKYHQNISKNAEAISRLKTACETAKRLLSKSKFAPINVKKLYDGKDLIFRITVEEFNKRCKDLVERTLEPVKNVLKEAKLTKDDIKNVVLVGGSTRIPYIHETLKEFFDGKKLNFDINPDEAVANGAAILAAHLSIEPDTSTEHDTSIKNIRLLDVIPRSLGTDLYLNQNDQNGYFNIVAKKNTHFPFVRKSRCSTLTRDQTEIDFVIFEGEDEDQLSNNKELGNFTLMNVAPGRPGNYRIEITFTVDANAILTVTAVDKRSKAVQSIKIHPDKGRLTDAEILEKSKEIQVLFDKINV